MGKNVAVFVDVANIFYAAKAAGVDIDYVTLLKAAIAGRDFVRAYAYTGLDPDNENQRNFHSFLARHGYKVVSKDIRKYGDGKVKANLDIELVVDMMKTARNLDVAIVISGDGDFAPAIRAVQEMGVRVEVISFRGNTSSDLIEVADVFTDIVALAKVERGSSRSGRRVADDEFDLSMTEVPDKQTEGTGRPRGRGGRPRSRTGEPATPVAARSGGRTESVPVAQPIAGAGSMTVLPGEKLSRVAASATAPVERAPSDADDAPDDELVEGEEFAAAGGTELDGEPRRRRRRGGRGRGRGRGRADEEQLPIAGEADGTEAIAAAAPATPRAPIRAIEEDEEPVEVAPRGPRPTPFGSIWDSQLGVPANRSAQLGPLPEDEDEDEPAIPEYLLAERRRGSAPQRGGSRPVQPRGRAGYSAAVDRERYGGNRASGGVGTGGMNRYPDVSRNQPAPQRSGPQRSGPRRDDRPAPVMRQDRPAQRSEEPWSEVPPEIEEMLRAQMAGRSSRPPERSPRPAGSETAVSATAETATAGSPDGATSSGTATAARGGRRRRPESVTAASATAEAATATVETATSAGAGTAAAPRGRGRRPAGSSAAAATPAGSQGDDTSGVEVAAPPTTSTTRGRGRSTTASRSATAAEPVAEGAPAKARRGRPAGTAAASGDGAAAPAAAAAPDKAPATRKRTTSAKPATAASAASSDAGAGTATAATAAPAKRGGRKKAGTTEQ